MSSAKKIVLLLGDIALLYASIALTVALRYPLRDFQSRFHGHFLPFSVIFVIWLLVFYLFDLYHDRAIRNEVSILQSLTWAVLVAGTFSIVAFYIFGGLFSLTPKTNLLLFAGIFLVLDYLWRDLMANVFSSGAWGIGIFGNSPLIERTIEYVKEHPHTGYKIVSWKKTLGDKDFEELENLARSGKIRFLIAETEATRDPRVLNAMYRLLPFQMDMMHFSDFYESIFGKVPLSETEERWFIEHIATHRTLYDASKSILDFSLALLAGIILSPILLLIGVIVRLSSPGPAIYRQKRAGKNGRVFTCYKFRTMYMDGKGPLWAEDGDRRVTPFGKFLRFTHFDEWPQLWNILKGDISITGPRPERVELAEQYQKFPFYEIRHLVKPGLTGWAQVNFKPSASLAEAREKLEYDIYYVKNRSFLLDTLIIVRTIRYIFAGHK